MVHTSAEVAKKLLPEHSSHRQDYNGVEIVLWRPFETASATPITWIREETNLCRDQGWLCWADAGCETELLKRVLDKEVEAEDRKYAARLEQEEAAKGPRPGDGALKRKTQAALHVPHPDNFMPLSPPACPAQNQRSSSSISIQTTSCPYRCPRISHRARGALHVPQSRRLHAPIAARVSRTELEELCMYLNPDDFMSPSLPACPAFFKYPNPDDFMPLSLPDCPAQNPRSLSNTTARQLEELFKYHNPDDFMPLSLPASPAQNPRISSSTTPRQLPKELFSVKPKELSKYAISHNPRSSSIVKIKTRETDSGRKRDEQCESGAKTKSTAKATVFA
ncbi:hypothetical protein FB567DRAFT_554611 [Paraphoma chrysanthemicola]|uniref:Uncharacterized protein n=1 Tax=Paraphoma chrysanthemicola TaxID=798071 RepID=A0A8K0VSF2_9PLEO|nr:hypothetical protein FB567DRAFT_554611 [Paraphoma chrysanthemicola]